jgi:hypothetical protein
MMSIGQHNRKWETTGGTDRMNECTAPSGNNDNNQASNIENNIEKEGRRGGGEEGRRSRGRSPRRRSGETHLEPPNRG